MIKKTTFLFIIFISFASSAYAMNDLKLTSRMTQHEWDTYIENGRFVLPQWAKWIDVTKTYAHNQKLQQMSNLDEIIDNPSTVAFAAQLDEVPSNEIVTRYENYKKVFDSFISLLIIKQYALKVIQKYPGSQLNGFSVSPSHSLQLAEQRMIPVSRWLDAVRNSGEEFYLGRSNLAVTTPSTSPESFWQSTMEKDVLLNLKKCYWDETTHLDPTSMATLRHQLRKGFQEEEKTLDR